MICAFWCKKQYFIVLQSPKEDASFENTISDVARCLCALTSPCEYTCEIRCRLQSYWLSNISVAQWSDLNMVLCICNSMYMSHLYISIGRGHVNEWNALSNTTRWERKIQCSFWLHDLDYNNLNVTRVGARRTVSYDLDVSLLSSAGTPHSRYHPLQPHG